MVKLFEKVELLDTVKHKNLRWRCFGSQCPQSCCYIPVRSNISIHEVISLSRFFPIHFPMVKYQENQEPQLELNIFFKLEKDPKPCVYLKDPEGCQLGPQKPIACKQYPFQAVKDNLGRTVLQIDFTCPGWVQEGIEGEPVFVDGKLNDYFMKGFVEPSMQFMNAGQETRAFLETLKLYNLIQGGEYRYRGVSVPINFVNEERLLSLPKEVLQEFKLKGYMQVIYAHLASLQNFQKLIDAYLERNPELAQETQSSSVFTL